MALLRTCLPKLRALDAHVPQSDTLVGAVLLRILDHNKYRNTRDGTASIPLTNPTPRCPAQVAWTGIRNAGAKQAAMDPSGSRRMK
jgi:hypothetical protein